MGSADLDDINFKNNGCSPAGIQMLETVAIVR